MAILIVGNQCDFLSESISVLVSSDGEEPEEAYLEELLRGGEYFSKEDMREREPYLHHEYVEGDVAA